MNPGPFGMVQTGIPFGEITMVKTWLKLSAPVGEPANVHPRRPVLGFGCTRREISGQRLWGAVARHFSEPECFFAEHFVANYCPLAFLEASGRNRTPDKLPAGERESLFAACDRHLRKICRPFRPNGSSVSGRLPDNGRRWPYREWQSKRGMFYIRVRPIPGPIVIGKGKRSRLSLAWAYAVPGIEPSAETIVTSRSIPRDYTPRFLNRVISWARLSTLSFWKML